MVVNAASLPCPAHRAALPTHPLILPQKSATRMEMGEVAINAAESAYDLVADMVSVRFVVALLLCVVALCECAPDARCALTTAHRLPGLSSAGEPHHVQPLEGSLHTRPLA